MENIEAPEKPLPNVPLEEDRKEDTSETADLTRDKAEEKNEETIRQVESTEIQNHEKGTFDEINDFFKKVIFLEKIFLLHYFFIKTQKKILLRQRTLLRVNFN